MMPISRFLRVGSSTTVTISIAKIASFGKLSYIVGSWGAFFSLAPAIIPVGGMIGGFSTTLTVFSAQVALHVLKGGFSGAHVLAYYLPGLCASLYWSKGTVWTRLIIPIACMALFVAHPIGMQAALYSLFWLIPIGIYVSRTSNIYVHALASSFIAHAVGSVIWLYTLSMAAPLWYSLMWRVPLERTALAVVMVLTYKGIKAFQNIVSSYKTKVIREVTASRMYNGR